MERINLNYSLKNITYHLPVPSKQSYIKTMVNEVEHFIKRLRWKAFFQQTEPDNTQEKFESYGV